MTLFGFIGCGNMGGSVAQTLSGSAELVLQSGQHPGALKDAVIAAYDKTRQR